MSFKVLRQFVIVIGIISVTHGFVVNSLLRKSIRPFFALQATKTLIPGLGGKIVVTGIGKLDEDEFALGLLNEQVFEL